MNTLAASSSKSFSPFGGRSRHAQTMSKPAALLDLPALQAASRVLQEQLAKDAQTVPDLGDMLTIRTFFVFLSINSWRVINPFLRPQLASSLQLHTRFSRMTTVSHFRNGDWLGYQKGSSNITTVRALSFCIINSGSDLRAATKVTSHMGLMPEIERVWISIDHNLFLWDYVQGCVANDCIIVFRSHHPLAKT